jgi:hypothetical protein
VSAEEDKAAARALTVALREAEEKATASAPPGDGRDRIIPPPKGDLAGLLRLVSLVLDPAIIRDRVASWLLLRQHADEVRRGVFLDLAALVRRKGATGATARDLASSPAVWQAVETALASARG